MKYCFECGHIMQLPIADQEGEKAFPVCEKCLGIHIVDCQVEEAPNEVVQTLLPDFMSWACDYAEPIRTIIINQAK